MTIRRLGIYPILILCLLAGAGWGQEDFYNHPELEWQSFETEHFIIHFHQETERTAREAAAVAEKIYGPVTQIYQYEPATKTNIIIKDVNDESNGVTYYYENKIEIWARPLDFDLRGSHRWMQDVITHEFVHIVQLAVSMKFTRTVPGAYLQVMWYEEEKREDVLQGYPNIVVSYPYPGVSIPPWFAEGAAQFMYPGANYDYWDSHRDMILRDRILNNNLLSLAAMSSFGKRGIGNESVYNQGFAFVRYLVSRYGVALLAETSRIMASPLSVSMSKALERATGKSGQELYREWKAELESHYFTATANVRANEVGGDILLSGGSTNLHPVWHPSERKFAFISNRQADFFGQTDLFVYDFISGKVEKIVTGVESAPCWSVDGQMLYYAGRSKPDKTGSRWLELYVYDMGQRKKEQITHGERVTSPILVDDGKAIAFLTISDGTSNIRQLDLDGGEITSLTAFSEGEYLHSLTYDEAENLLIFDVTINHGRRLLQLRLADGQIVPYQIDVPGVVVQSDVRDPVVVESDLFFSTDAAGIYNLYRLSDNGTTGYISNVTGGAFMPSVNAQGELLYSVYQNGGYKIAYMENPSYLEPQQVGMPAEYRRSLPYSPQEGPDMTLTPQPYQEIMSPLSIMPRITVDYGTLKPGVYFMANDVLDRLSILGGASINSYQDTDFFLLFEFRKLRPTLYSEFYAIKRHVSQDFIWYDYNGSNDLRFDLLEGVIGGGIAIGLHRFWLDLTLSQYREHITQKLANLSGDFSFAYYRGAVLAGRWQLNTRRAQYGGNMFPTKGSEIEVELRREFNDLIGGFRISEDYSTVVPDFIENNTFRLTLDFAQYFTIHRRSRISAAYEATLGWLSNCEIDTFFYFFGGGPPGLRGYTYYDSGVQGTNLMIHTLTLRVPLFLERNLPFWHLILQNASMGFVAQYGDGFQGSWLNHDYKSSVGMELRLNGYSLNVFPFALAYELHRACDRSSKGYRQYVSLTFDF